MRKNQYRDELKKYAKKKLKDLVNPTYIPNSLKLDKEYKENRKKLKLN